MNILILAGKNVKPTARKIAKLMQCKKISSGKYTNNFRAFPQICISYGSTELFNNERSNDVIQINFPASIQNTRNKGRMMKLLKDSNVPTPKLITTGEGFYRGIDQHNHKRNKPLLSDLYGTEIMNIKREYRVLIFQDNVYACMLKKPQIENPTERKLDNCNFIYVTPHPRIIEIARQALNALDLTFAGIDIALTEERCFRVIEVNSAPGLGEKNAILFTNELKKYIESISHTGKDLNLILTVKPEVQ